jgi:hypothetical protein
MESTLGICLHAYNHRGKSELMKKMNDKKTMMEKPSTIIAAAAIIAVVASAVIVLGMQNKFCRTH